MTSFSFTVPGPPVPLARPRVVRTKSGKTRTFTPDKSSNYEGRIGWLARAAMPKDWRTDGVVEVRLEVVFANGRHGDIDNVAKAYLDGMNKIVYGDDKQVGRLIVDRAYVKADPHVKVTVTWLWPSKPTVKVKSAKVLARETVRTIAAVLKGRRKVA